MAVFRIERTRDYTVMSNHHLKDTALSLKAKGLLSMMLSLPDEWNYTTRGLAAICKEGVDAIGGALRELEKAGYIVRRQLRGPGGRISDTEYTIYEKPCPGAEEPPEEPGPDTTPPDTAFPYLVEPDIAKRTMIQIPLSNAAIIGARAAKEERIAAIEAEQLRKKQEKGKRSEERRKQKLYAMREAAEAGDPVAIAQYEEHLAYQRERNQKHRQKLKEAREASPEYISQLEEKERIKREKMLETERKRVERAKKKKKLTRAELKEKAKTDHEAAKQLEAMRAKEAEARQRKKEREEARMAADPEYAAMMEARKKEYVRTRTAKRKAEHEALVELAKTDEEAARKLAEKRKYQSEATVKCYQKLKADAEAGDPEAMKRYEAHLAKRREDYHKKKAEKEDIPA